MPRRKYYSYSSRRKKSSAVIVTLNVIIIVLLVIVLSMLGLYAYTFFTGNRPFERFGITMPWDSAAMDEIQSVTVITPSETEDGTDLVGDTETASDGTVNIVLSDETVTTGETAETDPKYTSTVYDKDFYSNTLFIGDSIFTGLSGFGYIPAENVFAQVGLNPESALTKEIDGVTAASKVLAMQPERICIMLGTNGLAFLSTEYMSSEMGNLVDDLRASAPDTQIIILSIPPVTKEHEEENPEKIAVIEDYNSKLEKLAEEKDCIFINIFTMLQDDDGYLAEDYAEADGLHFLGKAYGVVLSRIENDITELYPDTENDTEDDTAGEEAVPADGTVTAVTAGTTPAAVTEQTTSASTAPVTESTTASEASVTSETASAVTSVTSETIALQ